MSSSSAAAPMSDATRKLRQSHLVCLIHADNCQGHEEQSNGEVTQCSIPYCKEMKSVLRHMSRCSDERSCTVSNCTFSRQVISHWKDCIKSDCPLCLSVKQETNANKGSSFCTLPHRSQFFQDFKAFFLKQENCDVVIRVKGREFPAHKLLLIARSPVFASLFENDMDEMEADIVDIEDCDPSSFLDFLCFIYCADASGLSQENVYSLFKTADKYDVSDLKEKCVEFMKENLSVDTFCETTTLALQHNEIELINFTTDFFLKNGPKVVSTAKWQSFLIENPIQTNKLCTQFILLHSKSNV